jgi:hypothetical protein
MREETYADRRIQSDPDNCFFCGRYTGIHARNSTTVDHLHPKSQGGNLSKKNKVYCCNECNSTKGDLSVEEFLRVILAMERQERSRHKRQMGYFRRVRKAIDGLKAIKRKNPSEQ